MVWCVVLSAAVRVDVDEGDGVCVCVCRVRVDGARRHPGLCAAGGSVWSNVCVCDAFCFVVLLNGSCLFRCLPPVGRVLYVAWGGRRVASRKARLSAASGWFVCQA